MGWGGERWCPRLGGKPTERRPGEPPAPRKASKRRHHARTPRAWMDHVVIICMGLGGWMLPFSVLLLINWFQPKTQADFGRGVPQPPALTS